MALLSALRVPGVYPGTLYSVLSLSPRWALLRSFPELLLLGRADCAQRVQVTVLVLVLGGCLGRRQVGWRPVHGRMKV